MEAALGHHHLGNLDAAGVTVGPCDLDGRLVGLRTGVAEEHAVHAGQARQRLGEALLKTDAIEIGGVNQLVRLLAQRGADGGIGVAEPAHGDAGQGVQVPFTVRVPQPGALAVAEGHRQARVGVHQRGIRGGVGVGARGVAH